MFSQLGDNQLSGELPSDMYKLSALVKWYKDGNSFFILNKTIAPLLLQFDSLFSPPFPCQSLSLSLLYMYIIIYYYYYFISAVSLYIYIPIYICV